jgi:hypothetical protein
MKLLPLGDRLPGPDIGARVGRTTSQSIPNGVSTAISFNGSRYDTNQIWSAVSPTRLTCKTAGKYLIGGCFRFEGNTVGSRFLIILLNGASQIGAGESVGSSTISNASCVYSLAVNDYVQMIAFQNSGQSLNILYEPLFTPEFYMQLLA